LVEWLSIDLELAWLWVQALGSWPKSSQEWL